MIPSRLVRAWILSASILAASIVVLAQTPAPFQPQVYQPGKDVVWVPTAHTLVDRMLDLAHVTSSDFVVDLGSGDGRTVIAAAKRGAHALGVEYNPDMFAVSRRNAVEAGVADRASFVQGDLFEVDLSKATVVTLFLLPELNVRLRPRLLDLPPGTRIVSNTFTMGEWVPDERSTVTDACETWCTALLWIVPARVDGTWRLDDGELTLSQAFQSIAGTLTTGDAEMAIANGRVRGTEISFSVGDTDYRGRAVGDAMEGTLARNGTHGAWHATRVRQTDAPARGASR